MWYLHHDQFSERLRWRHEEWHCASLRSSSCPKAPRRCLPRWARWRSWPFEDTKARGCRSKRYCLGGIQPKFFCRTWSARSHWSVLIAFWQLDLRACETASLAAFGHLHWLAAKSATHKIHTKGRCCAAACRFDCPEKPFQRQSSHWMEEGPGEELLAAAPRLGRPEPSCSEGGGGRSPRPLASNQNWSIATHDTSDRKGTQQNTEAPGINIKTVIRKNDFPPKVI